jgi:hypothetical protein
MITLRRLGSVLMLALLATATGSAASASRPARSDPRNASDRVVVRGKALLDGRPFDSRWVGAIVLKSGLATPCQSTLPHVRHGRYAVTVLADTESSGCGAPGAQIVLWTFAHETTLYSTNTVAWPAKKHSKNFAPRFSSHGAGGAAPELAEFTGAVFGADGTEVGPGTQVDAYVDGTRCGVRPQVARLHGIHPRCRRARVDRRMHTRQRAHIPHQRSPGCTDQRGQYTSRSARLAQPHIVMTIVLSRWRCG